MKPFHFILVIPRVYAKKFFFDRKLKFLACLKGQFKIVELLFKNGANMEAKKKDDWTPLHIGYSFFKKEMFFLL